MATGIEYRFCKICKRNHSDGRKHIYCKRHKEKLGVVLKSFGNKVHEARALLQKPSVIDGELEPGGKMWCYCCEQEIGKHTTDGRTSVELGGLLEHMASSDHHKSTRRFWWENGIDKSQLQKFILYEAELDRFKTRVSKELDKLDVMREKRTKQIAEQIKQTEAAQEAVARELPPQPLLTPPVAATQISSSTRLSTLSSSGNVHTGATPPWLISDNDTKQSQCSSVVLGPSEEDFLKWKEKNDKTRKKNPKRVGANFHQNLKRLGLWDNDDDEWLPNFGRVWNAGPRSHSRKEFKNELCVSSSISSSSQSSNSSVPHCSSSPVLIQPYVRRRPLKRPHPDNVSPMMGDN